MMHRTRLFRVNALVLALMLGGGGSGLPVFDALFHHFGGARTLAHACVERADTRSQHSERCTLSVAFPVLDGPGGGVSADRIGAAPATRPRRVPDGAPHSAPRSRTSLPRAPPVSIA